MDVADTKTNAKTKTQTNKKCLCYIFEEQGVLGEDVRTVDMVDMTMADMEHIDMVLIEWWTWFFNNLGSTHLEMVHSCIIL